VTTRSFVWMMIMIMLLMMMPLAAYHRKIYDSSSCPQVHGKDGWPQIVRRVKAEGPSALYQGSIAHAGCNETDFDDDDDEDDDDDATDCFLYRLTCLCLQVQGSDGWPQIVRRVKAEGPSALYQGSIAQSLATMVGALTPPVRCYHIVGEVIGLTTGRVCRCRVVRWGTIRGEFGGAG
jgi:hypothetical protein